MFSRSRLVAVAWWCLGLVCFSVGITFFSCAVVAWDSSMNHDSPYATTLRLASGVWGAGQVLTLASRLPLLGLLLSLVFFRWMLRSFERATPHSTSSPSVE